METKGTQLALPPNSPLLRDFHTRQHRWVPASSQVPADRVARLAGVGITRIGEGYGLKINLEEAPAKNAPLPADIDGVPVRIEVVGPIKKRPAPRQ